MLWSVVALALVLAGCSLADDGARIAARNADDVGRAAGGLVDDAARIGGLTDDVARSGAAADDAARAGGASRPAGGGATRAAGEATDDFARGCRRVLGNAWAGFANDNPDFTGTDEIRAGLLVYIRHHWPQLSPGQAFGAADLIAGEISSTFSPPDIAASQAIAHLCGR